MTRLSTVAARIAADDIDAFREFFDRELLGVLRFATSLVGDETSAEDLVQDGFLRLWQYRHRLNTESDPAGLLYTIIRNLAHNLAKRRGHEERAARILSVAAAAVDPAPDGDLEAALHRALAALSPRQREIVLLRWRQQLTYDEIGSRLGIASGTVAVHMQRAIAQLRDVLPALLS